jgi:hypothetical protein
MSKNMALKIANLIGELSKSANSIALNPILFYFVSLFIQSKFNQSTDTTKEKRKFCNSINRD